MNLLGKRISLTMVFSYVLYLLSASIILSATYRYLFASMNDALFIRLSILATILFVIAFTLLKLKRKIRVNVILAIFSTMIGIYIIEILLQFLYFGPITPQSRLQISDFDYRNIYQIYEDYKKKSIDVVPNIAPATFLSTDGITEKNFFSPLIPLSGISQKRTILCNESGEYAFYNSDKYGFNNNNIVWNNSENWVLVGDSFTHGACVDPEDNIAGRLNDQLDNKVINLGYSGNGPLLNLASIVEYAKTIKPEKVFWFYCEGNDLTDLKEELKS